MSGMDTPDVILPSCCQLCPRRCGADRAHGHRGVCGAACELRLARAALHFWEEPPISGDAGSGTVFFSNCPLHCIYCQNARIANGTCGADVSVSRLAAIFLEQQARGALNLNLVTGTHYVPQILAALHMARSAGCSLPVVWNSSGYETPETIALLADVVDLWLVDLRYSRCATAQVLSCAPDYPQVAREALLAMAQTPGKMIVRVLGIPGYLEDAAENLLWLWHNLGPKRATLSLMGQYTPVPRVADDPNLGRPLSPEEYEELLDFADEVGFDGYFWQEGGAAQESFIPDFDALEGVEGPELEELINRKSSFSQGPS